MDRRTAGFGVRGCTSRALTVIASIAIVADVWCEPRKVTGRRDPELFLIGGLIYEDGSVLLHPTFTTTGYESDVPAGQYAVTCVGKGGEVLHRLSFGGPLVREPDGRRCLPFALAMIFPEGTQEVRLTQNARKLTALTRSENPPIVKVLELRKIAEEKYLLRTGITDLDGDVPDVVVAYSANRGKTWLRLAGAKPSTVAKLVLDTSSLPGSDRGIIEVTASDGLNCAKARASISVPDRSPRVIAVGSLAPRDKEGQATYRVAAYDPEDGLLSGSSISWTTLEGVPLGSGGRLTTKHKPGDLRVVAVDSKGNRTAVRLIDVPK